MIKRPQIDRLAKHAQTGFTALLLLGVATIGLFVAGTTWVVFAAADAPGTDLVCNYPPIPDDSNQSMTPNGRPLQNASCPTIGMLLPKTDNTDKRFSHADRLFLKSCRICRLDEPDRSVCTSTCAVDALLGRQFTLVGAKPSGIG